MRPVQRPGFPPAQQQQTMQQQQTVQQQHSVQQTQQTSMQQHHTQQMMQTQQMRTTEQRVTRQQMQVHGTLVQGGAILQQSLPGDGTPPVFEKVFSNARFAQGRNAIFEGRVTGSPKPVVTWTRKSAPLNESAKYKMKYEEQTGNVTLMINQIGPGDEGEYTCTARNPWGEAICSVYIQPEGFAVPAQIGMRKETTETVTKSQQMHESQTGFQRTQMTERTQFTNGFTTVEEDFKVDTFEYRLLREVSFRESLTRRFAGESDVSISTTVERNLGPPSPPKLQHKPRNSKITENSDATFTANIAANPKPRLTWFKNGKRIVSSQKHQVSYSNQQASLKVGQVTSQDSGHYTLLAENPQGCVVASAYLAVEPSTGYDNSFESRETFEKSKVEVESMEGKMISPNFVRACTDRDVTEGKMTRFDCRVTGRPYPEVTWYINGQLVKDDLYHKILVNESGNHALMISNVTRQDSGVVSCIAKNKAGETSFQCKLNVIEKELVVAPKFVQRFSGVSVKEGEPFVLTARAVATPIPNISWQKDGVPITSGEGVRITTQNGGSSLEVDSARAEQGGWYQCTAQNIAGSTATRARVHVQKTRRDDTSQPQRLHLPTPTTVIQPEPTPEPEIIYLRHVERAAPRGPAPEQEKVYPPPQFIIPLRDTTQVEGGKIHFEARVEPVGDPTTRVDWYHNGRPLPASSRLTTTFRFGFIALDLLSVVTEDAGDFVCVVTSSTGTVQSVARLTVTERATVDKRSQHPDSLQYISQLEDYSKYTRTESVEEMNAARPQFIRPLHDLGQLQEGRNAHFEAQLTPVSDPTMRVDWFKDGRPITASSRITTICNFGYVSLNILHLRAEDTGVYTVRAVNRWGEAVSQSSLNVQARSTVTGDLGYPEQQRYIEGVEALEAYQHAQMRQIIEPPESTKPPKFLTQVQDQKGIKEGGFAHFEARLEPVGDSTLGVEWFKDGRPVEASSRITTFFNFGYVALTIKSVTVYDAGRYTCRAVNKLGEATTSAQLEVISKKDIISDSQHPAGLQQIQHLEDSSRYQRLTQEETMAIQKPRFLGPLKGTNKIVEGQRAHFEARVEPLSDTTMKIEWYHNGKSLQTANRIQTYHDFGYVAVDIMAVRADDAGTYTVVARNAAGEAQLSATMQVETRAGIDTTSMHRGAYDKTKRLEEYQHVEPQYNIEEISKSKPIFVTPLSDPQPTNEGKNVHLECKLEPMGDPTMRVEWFLNGKPITVGSRFRTYYDFGYVALDVIHVTSMDSGEYTVRATNQLGSAHTSACVRVLSRSDIVTETQNESSLEQIQYLEDMSRQKKHMQEDVQIMQPPQFSRPLHNIETIEGTNIHLECRLRPVGDPTMRVDWLVNGRPLRVGHRFRPAYDFDYVALDLLSVYPEDSGVYTCVAKNQLGEAVTSCSVKIIAKKDLILESQHPGGLEKIQYLEDTSRYKRSDVVDEMVTVKPHFLTKPKSAEVKESGHAHFECKLEPVTDSNLKVEWYKNGRPIIVGHRFRPIHDFGYVALDIVDCIAEDSGVYTCRAVNLLGSDETSCQLSCKASHQILTSTQNEMSLEQIQYLEDRAKYHRTEISEEMTNQAPIFTTSLKQVDIKEGQRAHFEARLIPVSDYTMKVEWFHNGAPVKSGSRFTETNNFGYVALDILHCLPEDSGTYTCRAKNILGEAVTSSALNVQSRKSIYLESQHEAALGRLNQLELRGRRPISYVEDVPTQPPVFTQPPKDLRTSENSPAHFEARLIPVGDPSLKVEWLRNGVPITASNRVTTMHDFGYVALNLKYVYPEDSGTYTCRAVNNLGQAVTSATLDVKSKAALLTESQHQAALQKLQMLEDSSKYTRQEEEEIIVTQKPHFSVRLNGPTNLVEGQSAHYECRVEPYPDPNMKVEWLHNGKPLQIGHRFRTTNDFGFASLDILTVYGEDAGEYTCRVVNKLGQATSSVSLKVQSKSSIISDTQHQQALQKIQYLEDDSRYKRSTTEEVQIMEKPQFGRPLKNIEHLPEGRPAHLEATLTPVNDPTMKVEWYYNGRPIPQGHRFKTTYDFGFVALDILYAYSEDSGTYMCKARNACGEAVTTCSVSVDSKESLELDTLDEQRLKKIRELEHYERPLKVELEPAQQKPVFITPLNSMENLKEGEHAHLECRVEPINDPHLKIEWFVNGVPIKTGHRFRTTHDFGYVALDILYTYSEDTGTYMCKATNLMGEAVNTSKIGVQSRKSIILDTQHPDGLEKIRELEAQGHPARLEVEEPQPSPPRFVSQLQGTKEAAEGQTLHFEAQIEPLHDPNLRVEIYHNGQPLTSASRFHITFDFGYFALDIDHLVPSDAGEYTVKAVNKLGHAVSSTNINISDKGSIIIESQRPEGLEKIRQLDAKGLPQRTEVSEPATRQRPVFTQPLQNIDFIGEGQNAHFECRLIPVGDPTLKVEWYRNDKLLEDSSRITKTHDFGLVSMDMTHVRSEDEGVYMCRASNALGEAVTTASMKINRKAAIQTETLHQEGMRRIQELEGGKEPQRRDIPEQEFEKPIFTQLLTGPAELWEGQRAHFEARVVPVGDASMRYLWYVNGKELKMGSRIHTTADFGFVTLDIMQTVPEDSGVYMCKAINNAGEAVSSTSFKVKPRSAISGETLQPDAWQKIQLKEAELGKVPEGFIEVLPQQPPVFTKHLANIDKIAEGAHVYMDAQVEPKNDSNLRIEWFKNGVPLTTGTRIRSTFDFGLVTLSINGARADDSGIYTCKATNLLGEAVSTCTVKVEDRHWLLANSLRPEALPLIDALEKPQDGRPEIAEPTFEGPVFISHLNNVECKEGDNAHFECKVEPAKDPTLKIEFFYNGKPLPTGARFKGTHDFGFVAIDINGSYEEDSGIYTVKATNSKGQASTSGTLKCTGKSDIYLQTQHPMGQAGLEKIQEVDSGYLSKQQRPEAGPDKAYPKPVWTKPLTAEFRLGEAQPLHLEGTVEPKDDPNLKIEWFFNGKALSHGSRFKMTSEFGFVTLDLIEVYERDQGIYTCKASNLSGEAFTSTTVYCTSKEGLVEKTQHPKGEEGLEKIQELEESLKREQIDQADQELGQAPKFTSEEYGQAPQFYEVFQNITNISEGEIAHFEASLIPVGDQTMKVEWFYNGKALEASHRTRTVHAFGMVVLEILGTKIEDSGTYTCRATNKWGQAEISVELTCVDISKGQKPQFTTHIKDVSGLKDGDSAHFECTLIPVGDPHMKVEWFHNGQPIRHSTRIKQVSDFGFVVMDIAYTQGHDSGEYVCRAKNKYGEDFTKAKLQCVGKGGVFLESLQPDSLARIRELESLQGAQAGAPGTPTTTEPPKFTTHFADIKQLKEGQSAHFEARLIPVNDPNLVVEWYFNGKKLPHGHRYRTFHDFGIVILDILYCYAENSGTYECRATNLVGSDSTQATLKCLSKANLILESQLPQGMEGGLEKIQNLEDAMFKRKDEQVSETKGQAPVFTVPLENIDSLREGENAHFEARLTPTNDPKLKVEWFWNNKPLRTGSRFRTFHDFGFVILEISPVYPEDSGEYSCRATNEYGEAVTTSVMKVAGKRSIILESQLPKGMEGTIDKIAELEGLGQLRQPTLPEDDLGKPPEFITTPSDLALPEYGLAHFECRLTPINDPSMVVEWFHNGKPLWAGSRIKTIHDFGFVILEIAQVDTRDIGLYTCKATNKHGEAMVSCKLQVKGRQGIIMEPQLPNTFSSGTESIQRLEEELHKREEVLPEDEKPNPPKFIVDLQDMDAEEGKGAHFDCKVEPVGDPTMRIDWFFNGRPFATGSRVHMLNDFGFIVLDMEYVYARDAGEYVCKATNRWGSATTKAKLTCKAKHDVVFDSQLPKGMSGEKLKELEKGHITEPRPDDATPTVPPKFITHIQSATVGESESVRFECKVEPKNDPGLRIEWYRNGKLLPSGHRYRTVFDMGFVSLDILYVYPEDSGEYVCRAVNAYGEDFTRATVSCKKVPSIILQNQVPKGMKKSEALMQMEATIKKYTSEVHLTEEDLYEPEKKQPPRFVTQIQDKLDLVEMEQTKFECQLAPVGDPNMKVEWFFNGKPLHHKNRLTPIYDFGYVAMNFGWVYPEDSGEYLCRATNLYGMDETRATIKTAGKPGIIYDSQLPKGMKSIEKIREMEAAWQMVSEEKVEEEKAKSAPVFVSKPEPCEVVEGECARFCCRVTGHPRPRVIWLINGHTVVNGMRYKLTYDGMWHLDIPKTRQYDHGKVEVVARNSGGESRVETLLNVRQRDDDYRGVLKNSPRPWYDIELAQYQAERQDTELNKVFEERQTHPGAMEYPELQKTRPKTPDPAWADQVKSKRGEEYYSKLRHLEEEQMIKETKLRESSHQFAIPGEKLLNKSVARGMAQDYESNLEREKKEVELMPWQVERNLKQIELNPVEAKQTDVQPWQIERNLRQVQTEQAGTEQEIMPWQKDVPLRKVDKPQATAQQEQVPWQDMNLRKIEQEDLERRQMEASRQEAMPWQKEKALKTVNQVELSKAEIKEKETMPWQREKNLKAVDQDQKVESKEVQPWQKDVSLRKVEKAEVDQVKTKELAAWQKEKRTRSTDRQQTDEMSQQREDTTIQQAHASRPPPQPTGSTVRGKEIHTAVHKQTQKEIQGDQEIHRKISTTERTEVEHKAQTQERVVQGPVKPADPPKFTKKIQPCRAFEQEQAKFEVEFDGDPLPTIQWYREDFPIKNSPDLQVHTFSTKSILILREVFVEDSGVFSCVAENRGGRAKCSANLIVEEKRKSGRGGIIPPSFLATIQAQIVPQGKIIRLDAKITATKPVDVYWLKDGKKVTPTGRVKIREDDTMYTLTVTDAVPEDSGDYECVAINNAGEARCEAEVIVEKKPTAKQPQQQKQPQQGEKQAPQVLEPMHDLTRNEGQAVLFKCKISSATPIQVQWYKGDKVVKPSKYFQMGRQGDDYTLRISEAFPEDEGKYKCVASNADGQTTVSANLKVLAPESGAEVAPSLSPMRDVTVPEGSPAQFKTTVSGTPSPNIQWYREGDLIPQSPDFQIINEGKNAILLIASTYEEDSGTFTCRATNSAGSVEASAKLIVKNKRQAGEAPQFTRTVKPVVARPGEKAVLECVVTGNPTPEVKWYRGDEEIKPDKDHIVEFNPETGVCRLTILKTTKIDETIYSVRATNKFGRAECRANLVISEFPLTKKPSEAPRIIKPLEAKVVTNGSTVTLDVEFTGLPHPTVKWYHNGKEITETEETVIDETRTTLTIKKITKKTGGKYEVRVTNDAGEARTSGSVTVVESEDETEGAKAPRFIQPLKPKIVTEGEVVIMEAVVESYPTCSFQWYMRNTPIQESVDVRIHTEANKSVIQIQKADKDLIGDVTCRAENVLGSVMSTASVQVLPQWETTSLLSPSFVETPVAAKVMDGEPALFTAKVVGQPTPQVVWLHNDKPIEEGKGKTIMQDSEGVCQLAISEVFPEDCGVYTCTATNTAGKAVCATTLVVEAYEYIPDSEIASVTVETAMIHSKSEEDLLEKDVLSEITEEGIAPTFLTPLPEVTQIQNGDLIRMTVQVDGIPKPIVTWYKAGQEIHPSPDFQIEEFEDGTCTLTVPQIFPDDQGEITVQAHNELGVASTTTVLEVVGILGTPEYRKPEWVTHMEDMQERLKAFKQVPRFVNEITDKLCVENESVTFECQFSGTPQPVVIWYLNDKIVRSSDNTKIVLKENLTSLTVKRVTEEESGTYVCKISSDIGMATTKAYLRIIGPGSDMQQVVEEMKEQAVEKKEKKKRKPKKVVEKVEETQRESIDVSEVQAIETASTFVESDESTFAKRVLDVQESVAVTSVAVCKKHEEQQDLPTDELTTAEVIMPIKDATQVTETRLEETVAEMTEKKAIVDSAKITSSVQESVSVTQITTEASAEEFISETATIQRATETIKKSTLKRATSSRVEVKSSEIEEVLNTVEVKEFGPGEAPIKELAKIGILLNKGISIEEVVCQYETGDFPSLRTPEAQNALVSVVEREGCGALISEMVTHSDSTDQTLTGVFSAFLTMVQLNHATIQQTIPLFKPQDFILPSFETTMPVITEESVTEALETIDEISEVTVQESKVRTREKKTIEITQEGPGPGSDVFAPRFIGKLQPKRVQDGGTVQFECTVEGNPRPQITWFRQTAIIKPSPDFQIFYDDDNVATLIINEVFPEDAGKFTCVAKNSAGFTSSTTELIVETPLSEHGSDATGHSRMSLSRESSLADIVEGIPPTFAKKPKARIAPEGSTVEFEVRLAAVPEPDIYWTVNGKTIKQSATVSITTTSDMHMYISKLRLEKVKTDQQGTYTVVAKNREGEASLDIILKVLSKEGEAPVLIEPLRDLVVTEGLLGNKLACVISGEPTPTVQWLCDGKPVTGGQSLPDGQHVLELPATQSKGLYTVKATNKHGSAETTANVIVQGSGQPQAPMFVKRFEEQKIREKGTIRLVAQVIGNPIPTVTWFRNNKTLLASPRVTEMYDGEQIVLEITDADSEEDAGDYKCVATNSVGSTTHGARITIDVEKVSFTKLLPPKLDVDEMGTVRLTCETSHTVSTTWVHQGKELSGMDHREIVQEGRQQSLVIKRAHLSDIGEYMCKVKDQKTSTQLTVHGVKADFVRKLEDFEVKEQEVAILEVEVSSDTAEVIWQKDGMELEPTPGKIEIEKSGTVRKLLIRSTSVHDEGEYTCVLGDQECSADISVIELPPEISTKMQDVIVPRGEKAMFEIELTKGDALVRWFKDDKELQFSEHVQLSIDGKKQKLKIYHSEDSDAGIYSCRVGDQVSTAKLTVEEPQVEFITRLPDVTMLPINTDAEFTVELSRADVNVKWLKKGKEIKASSRYIITSEGAKKKLVVKNITMEDQSDFTCLAMNIKTSTKLKVEVIEIAPKITKGPTEFRVKKGEDVTLDVQFKATPAPTAEWTVNGTVIQPSKKITPKIEEASASLTIKQVSVEDVGSYTIKLKNNVGEASAELTLIIIEIPGPPGKPDVIETSDSSVTIHWKEPQNTGNSPILSYIVEYHDKEEFMEWHEITDVKETTHKVTNLQTNHEVMFRVRAVNEVGKSETSDTTRYIVVTEPKEEEAPTVQQQLKDMTVGLGKDVTLSCVVSGVPVPEIKWFKDDKQLKVKTMSFEDRIAKLNIKTVETSGGKYTCRATNKIGYDETSCKLIIQESPVLKLDADSCIERLQVSNQWKPKVYYTGYPRPDITWKKDGNVIESSKKTSIFTEDSSTTIAIYSVERADSGLYTVTATNVAGTETAEINFRVIDKPSKPEAIGVIDVEVDTVTVEWKPPADDGGVDITKYSLEKCQVGKNNWTKVADIERDANSYIVQRLQTNNEYMFRLSAQNVVGSSDFVESESVTITSKLNKPSAPSAPLELQDMTENSCVISWGLPISDGGSQIIEYIVEKKLTTESTWTYVDSTTELTLLIKDLGKDEILDLRVSARNKIGTGPGLVSDEPITVGKRKNPPSPPQNLVVSKIASRSVSLQWNPPKENGGSEVSGYVIEKQSADKSTWTKVATIDSHVTCFTVENLKEKSELYFRVLAENSVGLSPPATTSLISLKTHATVPSPPTAPLEMRSTGATSVVVEWGVPESDGGAPIEGYKIAVRDMKKTMWMEVGQVAADVQRLAIRELQENHEYMIRIFARNEVGLSEPLESDEPFKVIKSGAGVEEDVGDFGLDKETPSISFSTTTQSWMREAGMDPDIYSYSRHTLLRRSEYFFRIWYYAKHLFK